METLPQLFSMGPFHANAGLRPLTPEEEILVARIAEDCPTGGILFEEEIPVPSTRAAANYRHDESDHDEQKG
ncbi:MAG: hypothetical protein Kow009_02030 [Spirochaetales bacterium]